MKILPYLGVTESVLYCGPVLTACRMMPGVRSTYDGRKSKREVGIRKVVGLLPMKNRVKKSTFVGPRTENVKNIIFCEMRLFV